MPPEGQKAEHAKRVLHLLKVLKEDDGFHADLKRPEVLKAVKHWTGEERLPVEGCEDFESDPRIMNVFSKLRNLGHACKLVGTKLPLFLVLEGRDDFLIPGMQEEKQEEQTGDDTEELEEIPHEPYPWKRSLAYQLVGLLVALLMSKWHSAQFAEQMMKELNQTGAVGFTDTG